MIRIQFGGHGCSPQVMYLYLIYIVFIFIIHRLSCSTCRTDWNCRRWWFLEYCPSTTILYELSLIMSCWWYISHVDWIFFSMMICSKLDLNPRQVLAMQKSCMLQLPSPTAKENIWQNPVRCHIQIGTIYYRQRTSYHLPYKYVNW